MIYKFRKGSRVSGIKAQAAGEAIAEIRERDGHIDTEIVLKEASKKRSPLHTSFEWNDKTAGHQYRLFQARQLIKALTVVLDEGNEPAYVHVKIDRENYYQSAEVAARNPEEWEVIRNTALYRLQGAVDSLDVLDRVAARCKPLVSNKARAAKTAVERAHEQLASA